MDHIIEALLSVLGVILVGAGALVWRTANRALQISSRQDTTLAMLLANLERLERDLMTHHALFGHPGIVSMAEAQRHEIEVLRAMHMSDISRLEQQFGNYPGARK